MAKKKGITVLLVDDDVFFSSLVEDELKDEAFDVMTARTLGEAKEKMESKHFDIAILDIWVPVGKDNDMVPADIIAADGGRRSGLVLAEWIRKKHRNVSIIGYSHASEEEFNDWFRQNGYGFFKKGYVKPIELVKYYICKKVRKKPSTGGLNCLIVHGHDKTSRYELKDYLRSYLKFPEPVILQDLPGGGLTIIEKFEKAAADVDLVFVLLTPDDKVYRNDDGTHIALRARQNVVFEMGYFLGKFGRTEGRVILLCKGKVELPSDIAGWGYIDISQGIKAAGVDIQKEISEAFP